METTHREDCTFMAWYRSLYAPRTGGAHDSHYRTAGIAGRARRRGGGVAARGARAAGGDAVVAFLNGASPAGYVPMVTAFGQGLKETGYVEGQNVAVEYRWAEGQYDRVPVIALELVGRQVAVIVANTPGVLAVKAAITTTPIVFTTASDPWTPLPK